MPHQNDYASLDRPEVLRSIFHPRKGFTSPPPYAVDHFVPVDKAISVSCRFYLHDPSSPNILFFHGNGEMVSDYDYIAPIYGSQAGANLFVADYRGYGASDGTPTFSSMVTDAHRVFKHFSAMLHDRGWKGSVSVMGRSLGSVSAIELASGYQAQINGLIIESGFASTVRLMTRLGLPPHFLGIQHVGFPNLSRIRTVTLRTLIIHSEYDRLIPLEEARDLFENSPAKDKRLVVIAGADHSDIMMADMPTYFGAIREFIFRPDRVEKP